MTTETELRYGYLHKAHVFGSPYDQADGVNVTYPAGTRVRLGEMDVAGYVWITAPNGRQALVSTAVVDFDIDVIRIDGQYICVNCGKQARDHPDSVLFPYPTFRTMCDGREVKT